MSVTIKNLRAALSKLDALALEISKWDKDLESAQKALANLEEYRELRSAISSGLMTEAGKRPDGEKSALLTEGREELARIKKTIETKGLSKKINEKISKLTTKEVSNQSKIKELEERSTKAQLRVESLLPKVTTAVKNYEQAKLEDKEALLEKFLSLRAKLNTQIEALSDKGVYQTQVSKLSQRVNKRTEILNKEEEKLKKKIQEVAKKAATAVSEMTVNEQILAIAPEQVRNAIQKVIANLNATDIRKMVEITNGSGEQALVSQMAGQLSASMKTELAVITKLSKEEQIQVVQALLSGEDNPHVNQLSQSTQMALTAVIINQLALTAKIDKKDKVALQEFSKNLITNMAQIEKGEATHLSVLFEVEDAKGKKEIRGFHIELGVLMANSVDNSALLSLHLLKNGANSNTTFFTEFTSLAQVGALLQLQSTSTKGKNLQTLMNSVLADASNLKQISGGVVTDVSEGALIALAKNSTSVVTSGLGMLSAAKQKLKVLGAISALAILKMTAGTVVQNREAQKHLGIVKYIGHDPMFMIVAPSPYTITASLVNPAPASLRPAIAAASETPLLDNINDLGPLNPPSPEEDEKPIGGVVVDEKVSKKKVLKKKPGYQAIKQPEQPNVNVAKLQRFLSTPVQINHELVKSYGEAINILESLTTRLEKKYGTSADEHRNAIIRANKLICIKFELVLSSYEEHGDVARLERESKNIIHSEVKKIYNTHRDSALYQFFGAISNLFSALWDRLFASNEVKQNKANTLQFFATTDRVTESAKDLYKFSGKMDELFNTVGVDISDVHDEDRQRGYNN